MLSFERLHLLLELRLLSGRQHAEDLFVEGFRSGRIARAPGGMSRGELIEEVLNLLLLLGREIDAGEPLRPTVIFVGRLVRLPLALGWCLGRRLRLLSGHGNRHGQSREQRGYAGDLHGPIIPGGPCRRLNEALRTR